MTPFLYQQFLTGPLAIDERHLNALAISMRRIAAGPQDGEEDDKKYTNFIARGVSHDFYGNKIPRTRIESGVATIPLAGIVSRGLGPLGEYFGFADISVFTAAVRAAADNPDVSAIHLQIDSPGGTVVGTADAARAVANAALAKPVIAYSAGLMASAAYYIAAGATKIIAGESAIVGSVGVITAVLDARGFYEKQGVNVHVFRSGEKKAIGAYAADEIDAQKAKSIQDEIDAIGAEFRAFVQSHRAIDDEALRGQIFTGTAAVAANLADATAPTMTDAIRSLSQ
jgi:signal peptide peptidase SppA